MIRTFNPESPPLVSRWVRGRTNGPLRVVELESLLRPFPAKVTDPFVWRLRSAAGIIRRTAALWLIPIPSVVLRRSIGSRIRICVFSDRRTRRVRSHQRCKQRLCCWAGVRPRRQRDVSGLSVQDHLSGAASKLSAEAVSPTSVRAGERHRRTHRTGGRTHRDSRIVIGREVDTRCSRL